MYHTSEEYITKSNLVWNFSNCIVQIISVILKVKTIIKIIHAYKVSYNIFLTGQCIIVLFIFNEYNVYRFRQVLYKSFNRNWSHLSK